MRIRSRLVAFFAVALGLTAIAVWALACGGGEGGPVVSTTETGVRAVTVTTDEAGTALIVPEEGTGVIEVHVHDAEGRAWDNVWVQYWNRETYRLFAVEDPLQRFPLTWRLFTNRVTSNTVDITTYVDGIERIEPILDEYRAAGALARDRASVAESLGCLDKESVELSGRLLGYIAYGKVFRAVGAADDVAKWLKEADPDYQEPQCTEVYRVMLAPPLTGTFQLYRPRFPGEDV